MPILGDHSRAAVAMTMLLELDEQIDRLAMLDADQYDAVVRELSWHGRQIEDLCRQVKKIADKAEGKS